MAVLTGVIAAGSLILGAGIAAGVLCVISGAVSAGAIAIHDAKKGTHTRLKAYICRAVLSALTLGVLSGPALFGLKRLFNGLSHREKEPWTGFFRKYDLATVICYGITHIPNRLMVLIVKWCTAAKASAKQIAENAVINSEILEKADFFTAGSYIENQIKWNSVRFGSSTMAYSGCEIMAVYNALHTMEKEMTVRDMVELISAFERKGAVLRGKWGCSSYAIYEYFLKRGYETVFTCSKDMRRVNEIGENFETVIITAYNNRYDVRSMIHTISASKDENGYYTLHNAYKKNSAGEYAAYAGDGKIESLRKAVSLMSYDGQASAICVIGISRLCKRNRNKLPVRSCLW